MFIKAIFALSALVLAGSSAALAMTSADHQKGFWSVPVYAQGKVIGQDTDANVRLQIVRDYQSRDRN